MSTRIQGGGMRVIEVRLNRQEIIRWFWYNRFTRRYLSDKYKLFWEKGRAVNWGLLQAFKQYYTDRQVPNLLFRNSPLLVVSHG
jgi:hypothetical protein